VFIYNLKVKINNLQGYICKLHVQYYMYLSDNLWHTIVNLQFPSLNLGLTFVNLKLASVNLELTSVNWESTN